MRLCAKQDTKLCGWTASFGSWFFLVLVRNPSRFLPHGCLKRSVEALYKTRAQAHPPSINTWTWIGITVFAQYPRDGAAVGLLRSTHLRSSSASCFLQASAPSQESVPCLSSQQWWVLVSPRFSFPCAELFARLRFLLPSWLSFSGSFLIFGLHRLAIRSPCALHEMCWVLVGVSGDAELALRKLLWGEGEKRQ